MKIRKAQKLIRSVLDVFKEQKFVWFKIVQIHRKKHLDAYWDIRKNMIFISRNFVLCATEQDVVDITLHELSHAIQDAQRPDLLFKAVILRNKLRREGKKEQAKKLSENRAHGTYFQRTYRRLIKEYDRRENDRTHN